MYETIKYMVLPPSLVFFLLATLVIVMWWRRAAKRRWLVCLTLVTVLYYLCSASIVTRLFVGSLEWSYPQRAALPGRADVIVMLGAGCLYHGDDPFPLYVMDEPAMKRTIHTAEVYHHLGGCPVILCGYYDNGRNHQNLRYPDDPVRNSPMGRLLLDLGVKRDDIILEEESRTTYENAVNAKKLIEERNFKEIVLVTDAAHMHRGARCFEKLGLRVTPTPCNYYAEAFEITPRTVLPSAIGTRQAYIAAQEYLGRLWYWFQGRI